MTRIEAVFFDAAGTLIAVNGSVGGIYARLAQAHGKTVAVADLEAGFGRAFAAAPPMAFPGAAAGEIPALEKKWWRELVLQVFSPLGPFPAFGAYFDELYDFFAQPRGWGLYPDTRPALEALHARGVRLGVISNFDSRLFGLLDGLGIARFFDPTVISTRAGAAKPDTAIFSHALAHHGLAPEHAVHVGDSYEMDVLGAQAAGLQPVLIDRRAEPSRPGTCLSVSDLVHLPALLDRLETARSGRS